ncbi:MAG: hypothetical protein IKU29_01010 [Parabacteroides sp.]|nr:hypothetical protein [Parabacteroides sp.]
MKRQIQSIFIFLLIIITAFCLWAGKRAYISQQEQAQEKAATILKQSIQLERDKYIGNTVYSHYNPSESKSPDISWIEKEAWVYQRSLSNKDPNRVHLDSIFNAELQRQNIQGKGAIYFSQSGKTVCTASDTLFKEKAVLVDRLTFRLDHNPDNLCIIEGYVKFPTGWLLAKTKAIPYILFAWVLSIFLSIGGYRYWIHTEKKKMTELEKRKTESEGWIKLPNDIHFDPTRGIVKQQETSVNLTDMNRELFNAFLDAEHHFLTYEQMYHLFSPSNRTDIELSRNEKNTISSMAIRLRRQIKPITAIQILSFPNNGYQLTFKETQVSEKSKRKG